MSFNILAFKKFDDFSLFPDIGESNYFYVDLDLMHFYKWDDTINDYVRLGADLEALILDLQNNKIDKTDYNNNFLLMGG